MLRRCADLSRDAAGPPDQLPFSEAAPVAVLQASVSDMPALCDRLSSHELVQRDGLCIHVSALLGEIIHSLRFVTDSNDRCLVTRIANNGADMWSLQCRNTVTILCWLDDSNNSRVGSLNSQTAYVFCRYHFDS